MNDLVEQGNLYRAWRWVRGNADASYKSYFRELYSIYAVADLALLDDLRNRIKRGLYEPRRACKIFFPKPSGILRPYTLLTIEDQIVYQASVNVIAERLFPKVHRRYNKEIFGHLYAGKSSPWFYRKWSDGYKKFNKAAREAFEDGFIYTASFDLTACYDSLDHGVLNYFLKRLGCDKGFCDLLIECLNKWTAIDHGIYHNHGIPQGPLSSGLLSEVVLKHFDEKRGREGSIVYFRYVDDIRLFAKNEKALRRMLVRLDQLSKEIGLFPQSSKISIHKVKDIKEELKSISNPTESSIVFRQVHQESLRKRITDLTPRHKVTDSTRFKYLLAHAKPNSKLTGRLWRIHSKAPEFYQNISRYLTKYITLPKKAAESLLTEIRSQNLYQAVTASFVEVSQGRIPKTLEAKAKRIIADKWKPAFAPADLVAAVARWMIYYDQFSHRQMETACQSKKHWWTSAHITLALNDKLIGGPSLESTVNKLLRADSDETALAAAYLTFSQDLSVFSPKSNLNRTAAKILKDLGIIKRATSQVCGIQTSLERMAGANEKVNWKSFFGSDYKKVESQIVVCRALAETNITAWINAFDVFNDWLLINLYRNDSTLGHYTPGSIGSVMNSKRLRMKYPGVQAMIEKIHLKRYESNLSHAKQRRTGRATGIIKFSFFRVAKPLIQNAVIEISKKW